MYISSERNKNRRKEFHAKIILGENEKFSDFVTAEKSV